jgi:hypothetical protein
VVVRLLGEQLEDGGSAESIAARRRGEEYLLERKLSRRKSTGEVVNAAWLQFTFPTRWHYDVLRALEYFRSVGDVPDSRMDEAIENGDGRPSQWNTLGALRVLSWYEQSAT